MWKDEVDGRELLILVVYIVTKKNPDPMEPLAREFSFGPRTRINTGI